MEEGEAAEAVEEVEVAEEVAEEVEEVEVAEEVAVEADNQQQLQRPPHTPLM